MKKLKYLILACSLSLATFSCDDYLDVNTSPNNPTGETVPANLVLAGALETIYPTQSNTMNRLGNAFMNTWGPNINAFTGGFADEFSLAIDTNFYSGIWDSLYLGIYPFQAIIDSEGAGFDNHKAIALVMKTFYSQYLVDLYGDIPYSQAWLRSNNLNPSYDNDQDIYRALIIALDDAIALIDAGNGAGVGSEDIVFGGNMTDWKNFANTIKLRILVREATKAETDTDSATYLTQQFALLDNSFVSTNVTINPGYSDESNDRLSPFYGTYGFNNEGAPTTTNNFIRASEYAVQFLQGIVGPGVSDPRIAELYAANNQGNIVGIRQGEQDNGSVDLSGLGSGLIVSPDQDGYIMTAAEAYFLQAEAMERGYLSGDAETAYNNGIQASFDLLGTAGASTYYGNPAVAYASVPNKIEAIMTQKWIAVNGINAIESWIDYTRTGFPIVPLPTSAQFTDKPNRLMYPASEYSGNSANVPTQTQADAFSTTIFWDN